MSAGMQGHPGMRDTGEQLATDISQTITRYTEKIPTGYLCLFCSGQSRNISNHKAHMLKHLREDKPLMYRLENFCDLITFDRGAKEFSCVVCKKVYKSRTMNKKSDKCVHFITKHLN